MPVNVTVEVVPCYGSPVGDAAVSVWSSGVIVDNDTLGNFSGDYFSAFRSSDAPGGTYSEVYNVQIMSADGNPFDIEKLIIADNGNVPDGILFYALDENKNYLTSTSMSTTGVDVNGPFNSQEVVLNFTGVYGIEIVALNNSGGPFYFDSDAFASIMVPPAPDTTAPELSSASPMDDAVAIAAGANVVLTFSEDVQAGTGNITLVNAADSSDTRVISITSGEVSIAGGVITINPSADLVHGASYSVEIDAGAVTDLAGNDYAGLSDPTELNFTVAAAAPPSGGSPSEPAEDPVGTDGPDKLVGDGHDNLLRAGLDDDYVSAGNGNDTVYGGAGDDTIYSGDGDDVSYGGVGTDKVFGGAGDDVVGGGEGNDSLYAGVGDDVAYSGTGDDIVYSGAGSDVVYGAAGNDLAYGADGADLVYGGAGADTVYGGAGDDTIWGGIDDDLLYGGAGADVYGFAAGSGDDSIQGFDADMGDTIRLEGQTYVAADNADGNLVLTLSGGGSVVLEGLHAAQVEADWFV